MKFKLLLIFITVARVNAIKSDCDGFFACLSDVFSDFFGSELNKTDTENNTTRYNNIAKINIKTDYNDTSISAFDLSHLQKDLNKAIKEVSSVITEGVNNNFKVNYEKSETVNNKTNIHVKSFELNESSDVIPKSQDDNTEEVIPITDSRPPYSSGYAENESYHDMENIITSTIVPILGLDLSNITTDETINITGKITPIITDNPLSSQRENYETDRNNSDTIENVTAIYIEPLHIEIIPDITIPFGGGVQDVVKDLTDKIIKNISYSNSLSNVDGESKATFKYIINHRDEVIAPNNYSIYEQQDTIDHQIFFQNLFKDFKPPTVDSTNGTTIFYNFTTPINFNEISNNDKVYSENTFENEIPVDFDLDYDNNGTEDDNSPDYLTVDYIELYKDTTNEDVNYIPTEPVKTNSNAHINNDLDNVIEYSEIQEVLANDTHNGSYNQGSSEDMEPIKWIATIFIKNNTSGQFDYFCDGAILTKRLVLTAAACVHRPDEALQPDDVIVITGKRNLQTFAEGETAHRVKLITVHEGFSTEVKANDLAVLELEDAVQFGESSGLATWHCGGGGQGDMTTGWAVTGELAIIHFDKEGSVDCDGRTDFEKTFCASYGFGVSTCPSYGGIYIIRYDDQWCLKGIRTGDPFDRSLCVDRRLRYTDVDKHKEWIEQRIMDVVS